MFCVTLRQPWAWAVCHAGMDVLNRPQPTRNDVIGERIGIHAGKQWDQQGADAIERLTDYHAMKWWGWRPCPESHEPDDYERCTVCTDDERDDWPIWTGAVVGVATITGSHLWSDVNACAETDAEGWINGRGMCSDWAVGQTGGKIAHHWQLADVQTLASPVPARGRLGLWKPDSDIVAAVEAQL